MPRGYSVLFVKAVKMFRHLFAHGRPVVEKQIRKYLYPDILIIDDFGLTALTPYRRRTSMRS